MDQRQSYHRKHAVDDIAESCHANVDPPLHNAGRSAHLLLLVCSGHEQLLVAWSQWHLCCRLVHRPELNRVELL